MPHPFERVLIVEDLEEARLWLAEVVPLALPAAGRVDAVSSLAEAREAMRSCTYGLAIVDWSLPDGTSEDLIRQLVAAREDCVVVVATIHDDDAHVFPALRAGATGYILKSRPREEVVTQLRRIETGEPALSPSIALRVLRHFHAVPPAHAARAAPVSVIATQQPAQPRLTDREIDVLRLIAKGYRSPEVAPILGISPSTVSSYVRDIYRKLGITSRAEAAVEAARRGLVA